MENIRWEEEQTEMVYGHIKIPNWLEVFIDRIVKD